MVINLKNSFFIGILLILFSSCMEIEGNGEFIEKNLDYSGFKKVSISIPANVQYYISENYGVKIYAESNIIDELDIYIRQDELNFTFDNSFYEKINIKEPISIHISSPQLNSIKASHSSKILIKDALMTSSFECTLSGASQLSMDQLSVDHFRGKFSSASQCNISGLTANDVLINSSGASEVSIQKCQIETLQSKLSGSSDLQIIGGVCGSMDLQLSGASRFQSPHVISQDVFLTASGASNAQIQAKKSLLGKASGASSIYYYGMDNPQIKTSGGAKVESIFLGGSNNSQNNLDKESDMDYDAIDQE